MANLIGESGYKVQLVQQFLKELGFYVDEIDGVFNFSLAGAIDNYQRSLGITQTGGIWDEATESATNYLVHFRSSGTKWWSSTLGGQVGFDPATAHQLPTIRPSDRLDSAPITTTPAPSPQTGYPSTGGPSINVDDAVARTSAWLQQFGLTGLDSFIRDAMINGRSEAEVRLDLYNEPVFKARFPAIFTRMEAGMYVPSPEEYLELEKRYTEVLHFAGLPKGMFDDPTDFSAWITQDVSPNELASRVQDGYLRVTQSTQEVRDYFAAWFGADGDAALAAYFIDPDRAAPELLRQATMAQIGGRADMAGFTLQQSHALRLAQAGITDATAEQGFEQLAGLEPLFNETLGEGTDLTPLGEGLDAVFNLAPGAKQALEARRSGRVNVFQGGGGGLIGSEGLQGLGTNR